MSAATRTRLDGRAAASVTIGAVGLFLFNIVFGPIAIGLGIVATLAARGGDSGADAGRRNRAAGVIGIVLGVADLVVLAVLVAARVHGGTFGWHLG
jgi:hypothetical protein